MIMAAIFAKSRYEVRSSHDSDKNYDFSATNYLSLSDDRLKIV